MKPSPHVDYWELFTGSQWFYITCSISATLRIWILKMEMAAIFLQVPNQTDTATFLWYFVLGYSILMI